MSNYFRVVYAKAGQIKHDNFPRLAEAIADFNKKREADALNIFDDRFVIHIEDCSGEVVYPKAERSCV